MQDDTSFEDAEGMEFPDAETARVECMRFAGQVIADAGLRDGSCRSWTFEVVDETGRLLFRMAFTVADLRRAV